LRSKDPLAGGVGFGPLATLGRPKVEAIQ
jgi:hypothetical protein